MQKPDRLFYSLTPQLIYIHTLCHLYNVILKSARTEELSQCRKSKKCCIIEKYIHACSCQHNCTFASQVYTSSRPILYAFFMNRVSEEYSSLLSFFIMEFSISHAQRRKRWMLVLDIVFCRCHVRIGALKVETNHIRTYTAIIKVTSNDPCKVCVMAMVSLGMITP